MQRVSRALALTPLLPCALLAQVIQVSGGGLALHLAVTQAPNGAVLVVAPGTYYPFSASQRHLTIVAPQRATISYDYLNSTGPMYVSVSGASASQPVRMIGLDVAYGSQPTYPGYLLGRIDCRDAHVEDCTCHWIRALGGLVVVDRTTASSPDAWGITADPGTLVLTDSTVVGGCAPPLFGPPFPSAGIRISGAVLRAERVQVQGGGCLFPGSPALELVDQGVPCVATIADSVLVPGSGGSPSIACTPGTALTSSGNQLPGGVSCTPAGGSLAALRWLQRQWTPGGTSSLRCHEAPTTLAIVVASFSIVRNPTPLTSELIFAGATPDWFVWTAGVTNTLGDFDFGLQLPNVSAALYASVWLHGLTGTAFPFHATTPLGGLVY